MKLESENTGWPKQIFYSLRFWILFNTMVGSLIQSLKNEFEVSFWVTLSVWKWKLSNSRQVVNSELNYQNKSSMRVLTKLVNLIWNWSCELCKITFPRLLSQRSHFPWKTLSLKCRCFGFNYHLGRVISCLILLLLERVIWVEKEDWKVGHSWIEGTNCKHFNNSICPFCKEERFGIVGISHKATISNGS